ncbi:MAG: hypothetical protein ACRYGK_10110 [Janthinobacterium lividum]
MLQHTVAVAGQTGVPLAQEAQLKDIMPAVLHIAPGCHTPPYKEPDMSKSQDSKKAVKKEPAKTMKEKKADKKIKKEEKKRQ